LGRFRVYVGEHLEDEELGWAPLKRVNACLHSLEAGYSTPSAFIAAFRRALGTTPSRYFKDARN